MTNTETLNPIKLGLREGPMTKTTGSIREVVGMLQGEGLVYVENALKWVHQNFETPQNKPDKMARTADEILSGKPDPSIANKRPIAHCTEYGKLIRAVLVAKGLPTIWVNGIPEDWIAAEGEWSDPDSYSNHVFLDVYVGSQWYTINTTGVPDFERNPARTGDDTDRYFLDFNGRRVEYRPHMKGLDHMEVWTPDGRKQSFKTKKEWHVFINHEFPERMKRLERNPEHY